MILVRSAKESDEATCEQYFSDEINDHLLLKKYFLSYCQHTNTKIEGSGPWSRVRVERHAQVEDWDCHTGGLRTD